jgi:hypothetical protein
MRLFTTVSSIHNEIKTKRSSSDSIVSERMCKRSHVKFVGFALGEWKPIFKSKNKVRTRISIMQIAFVDQIFLIDLLNPFGNDPIEQVLINRLFDDEQITVIGTSDGISS